MIVPDASGRLRNYGVLARTLVLAREESDELVLQVSFSAVLLRRFERVHRRAVVAPELADNVSRRSIELEPVRVADERDLVARNSCGHEPLHHVLLDAPRHRADEPF